MVNGTFAYQKTGGVNITRQKWHLPSLQIYSSVLTILQHIYSAGQICENPIFRPVHKHYVIIACCEDIYGPYCIQKINNDHFLPLSAIIIFKMKNSLFSVSGINKRDLNFLHLQIVFTCLTPEKPRDIAFISSIRLGVQRWRV